MQRFAFALRKLREEAGGITYRAMAHRAGYSVTTLSRAANGEQLPTLPVTLAYVAACGGDADEWEARWREAAEETAARPIVVIDPYPGNRSVEVRSADGPRTRIKLPLKPGQTLRRAAVSADDRLLALCPAGGPAEIWEVTTRRRLPPRRSLAGPDVCGVGRGDLRDLRFTPDGRNLAVTTGAGVRTYDLATGRKRLRIERPGLTWTRFSEDGELVAAVGDDEILVWRTAGPARPVLRYPLLGEDATQLRLDPERGVLHYLGGASGHVVRSLDLRGVVGTTWREKALRWAVFSPDGRTLSTVDGQGERRLFRVRDGRGGAGLAALRDVPCAGGDSPGPRRAPRGCERFTLFTRDGRTIVAEVSPPDAARYRQDVTLTDLAAPHRRTVINLAPPEKSEQGGGGSVDLKLTPDGKTLIVSRFQKDRPITAIELWDVRRRVRTKVLPHTEAAIVEFLSDGRRVLTADSIITEVKTGAVSRLPFMESGINGTTAASADGRLLAGGTYVSQITLWSGRTQRRLAVLTANFTGVSRNGPAGLISAMAFSRDGRVLAAAGEDGGIRLWDTESHLQLGPTLSTQGDRILSLAFGRDGDTLYAAGSRVPLHTYPIAPGGVAEEVCRRVQGQPSTAQWRALMPDLPYRNPC
ncbi:helix-turn-helix domain-containing protein [Streptomyces sp. DSM 41529]|uniref:Helix-turn-helix domain-containing protein n=2 Tax=Streptomyces TaxID=1883 RepID=A0ABU2XR48_9ACTN|nr:helix-turn-helix domain-containing protein [Streptomyces sp. DSM 41529]MDT0548390.1 helix-turn-helix domain-containing protein [Streptomyces sp. DSM 41529]